MVRGGCAKTVGERGLQKNLRNGKALSGRGGYSCYRLHHQYCRGIYAGFRVFLLCERHVLYGRDYRAPDFCQERNEGAKLLH